MVVIGLVGASYALTDGFHFSSGSSSTVTVVSKWTYDSIPGNQYDAVAFIVHTSSVINGSFTNSGVVSVYVMTPAELVSFSRTGVVSGYDWTSGEVAPLSLYGLDVRLAASPWDLVFLNPDPLNATVIDFWTAVTETPT